MNSTKRLTIIILMFVVGGGACARWEGAVDRVDGGSNLNDPDGRVVTDTGIGWDASGECDPDPPLGQGDKCASAIDLGDLSDVAADVLMVTGNAMPSQREIWWTFRATDDLDTDGDEFHVDIRFLVNSDDAYEMDIYKNSCSAVDRLCENTRGPFDWYTDQLTTEAGCSGPPPCGEGDCVAAPGREGVNVCDNNTSFFYVVVRRTDGVEDCDGFTLELSNGLYAAP